MDDRRDRARAAVAAALALALTLFGVRARAQALTEPPVQTEEQAPADQTPAAAPEAPQAPAPLDITFSSHALSRMLQRGVNMTLVEQIIATRAPFRYYHRGRWEQGYYDPDSGLFIAMAGNVVITVITDVTPRYVARLKRARPTSP